MEMKHRIYLNCGSTSIDYYPTLCQRPQPLYSSELWRAPSCQLLECCNRPSTLPSRIMSLRRAADAGGAQATESHDQDQKDAKASDLISRLPQDIDDIICSVDQAVNLSTMEQFSCRGITDITEDGILCLILSFLQMREAVRTTILSRRWKNKWTSIPNLVFSARNMLDIDPLYKDDCSFFRLDGKKQLEIFRKRRYMLINSVHHVLRHHQGYGVNLFAVHFCLNNKHARHLDQWLSFAVKSGAKKISLCLLEIERVDQREDVYTFPCHLFADEKGTSVECLHLDYCKLSVSVDFLGFSSLKILYLDHMYITDVDISVILSICSSIEMLGIHRCQGLVNLNISNRSGKIKLSVDDCPNLMRIQFRSVIVTSFRYIGDWVAISQINAPVVKAHLMLSDKEFTTLAELPHIFPQLQDLFFYINSPIEVEILPVSCMFSNLKLLVLFSRFHPEDYIYKSALFLNAAPYLEKLIVHMQCWLMPERTFLRRALPGHIHNKLKQLEIGGFSGQSGAVDLVYHVFSYAIALEQIIIDPHTWRHAWEKGWWKDPTISREVDYSRQYAELDFSRLCKLSDVKLVIR